jgi:hypothetical protein
MPILQSGKIQIVLEAMRCFREKSRKALTARGAMDQVALTSGLHKR